MYSSHSFTKIPRQSITPQEQLFSSNRLSHDSQYYTQGGSKTIDQDSDLQCYLPESSSSCSMGPLSKTTHFGSQKNKKTVKTIKLKSNLKSESNENDISELKQSKFSRLHTENNYQSSQKPFRKFRLVESTINTPLQSSTLNLKNLRSTKPKICNGTITPNNKISNNSSSNVTCRQSEIYSLSPIKDKIKLQVKLKKVENLYEDSIQNYKQLLIKFSIQMQRNKLLEKQKARIRQQKQLVETMVRQKQQIIKKKDELIKQKQKSIVDTHKLVKQKQLIINSKNQQFSSIISQYEYRINNYQQSIGRCQQQLFRTKNQLSSLNLKIEPFNSKLISCLDQIEYLKHNKEELVKSHIQQLYFKNKQILRLNQVIENNKSNKNIQNQIIGISFDTFGTNQNKQLSPQSNNNNCLINLRDYQNYQNYNENQSSYKSECYQDLDEKISVVIESKGRDINRNNEIKMFQPINSYSAIKRNSLMDMKEVMSVDGAEDTYRSKCT